MKFNLRKFFKENYMKFYKKLPGSKFLIKCIPGPEACPGLSQTSNMEHSAT